MLLPLSMRQAWSGSDAFGGRRLSDQYFIIALSTNVLDVGAAVPSADQHNRCRYRHGDPFHQLRHDCQRQHSLCAPADRRQLFQWCCHRRNAAHCLSRAGAGRSRHHPATIGPVQMTDALGRKFWRFTGSSALIIANALNALNMRQMMVFCCLALRQVRMGTDWALLSLHIPPIPTKRTPQTNGYILRAQRQPAPTRWRGLNREPWNASPQRMVVSFPARRCMWWASIRALRQMAAGGSHQSGRGRRCP